VIVHTRSRRAALTRVAVASFSISMTLALVTPVAAAQTSCSVTGTSGKCSPTVSLSSPGTIVNPALLQLTVSPTSSTYTAAATDMNASNGLAAQSVVTLTVEANRSWTVHVNGNTSVWSGSSGAWTSKPVGDLIWSLTPTGTTTAMSTTAQTLTTGSPGLGSPGVAVYMRPVAHWTTDKPGTYSMNVTFTLSTP
jgi:hypothetical protein